MSTEAALASAADALGRNAVPWFLAALVAVLVAFGGSGAWVLHHSRLADKARVGSMPDLALRLAIGFAIVVAAAALFATIAGEIGAGEMLGRLDAIVSQSVGAHLSPELRRVFGVITHLGDPATLTVLCVAVAGVLLLRRERGLALGWVVAIAGNALLNVTLKGVFERVRPARDPNLVPVDGWSFPSGHSSGSVVAYGMLAYVLIRTLPRAYHVPVVLAAVAIAFTTGCSRIFLQAHYPTDVAAGFASGTAWLAACIVSVEMTRHYRQSRHRSRH
jgi:undecaprenyl-diphosphatase